MKLGLPLITGDVTAAGRDAAGSFYVDLALTNRGTGHARGIRLTTIKFITLSGRGVVTFNAAQSGALPLAVGSLDAGATTAAPAVSQRAGHSETLLDHRRWHVQDCHRHRLPLIAAQIVVVPR